jgi:hypothetical protein
VSLSGDGNTALVGGPYDNKGGPFANSGAGTAWVYTLSGGAWSQQAKLVGTGVVGSGRAAQGWSASLSGDGNTAIVGGPGDSGHAAWVFAQPVFR